ncbi:ABC transporter ATP-binding protein [Erysipelothrix urinaevulpis]|uniref:ABC transporter ATP-binding protein n=1 Tax=Erysipelothrix urinaevulpis TaxID=2683717 RepID=UPI0019155419|nr:ABC transporter ATP-binding protein [Erysipelothrix urinaevulpis]
MEKEKQAMISIHDVTVRYDGQKGETLAIDQVNLNIYKGDFIVLLGPSGCGKSTLLNLVAGYHQASQGDVLMYGKEISGPNKNRGVVFQSTNLYPWLSVRQNIEYGLNIAKIDKPLRTQKSDEYLKAINLENYANHYPFELSGGMQQRVALARTLINEPEILLMDEPFGALDAMTRVNMQSLLRKLWNNGKQTFFLITHDIDEALLLGSRVLVMSKNPGTIVEEFKLDFHQKALMDKNYNSLLDEEFVDVKNRILQIIANESL